MPLALLFANGPLSQVQKMIVYFLPEMLTYEYKYELFQGGEKARHVHFRFSTHRCG